jgi:uncharacterized protein (DUF2062 family)
VNLDPRRWLQRHSLKLLAIRDTPEAIAGGVAIGVFFGFMPLFGLKTALTVLFAWLMRCNLIAAILAVTAHDVLGPLVPAMYYWQYYLGCWVLGVPRHWHDVVGQLHHGIRSWHNWIPVLLSVGKPLLIGGALFATPFSALAFVLMRAFIVAHRRRRLERKQQGKDVGPDAVP